MTQFLQLVADPDRMNAHLHGHAGMRYFREPLLDRLRGRPEPAPVDDLTIYVERAVLAPDVARVDADRHLNPRLPTWDFSNALLRWLLYEKQSLRSGRPAHPI